MTYQNSPFDSPISVDVDNVFDEASTVYQDAYNKVVSLSRSIDKLIDDTPRLIDDKVRIISTKPGPYTFNSFGYEFHIWINGTDWNDSFDFKQQLHTASEVADEINNASGFSDRVFASTAPIDGSTYVILETVEGGSDINLGFDRTNSAGGIIGFPRPTGLPEFYYSQLNEFNKLIDNSDGLDISINDDITTLLSRLRNKLHELNNMTIGYKKIHQLDILEDEFGTKLDRFLSGQAPFTAFNS